MEFDVTKLADGTLHEVAGILSSEAVDRDKQVFDYDGSKPFFEQWSKDVFEATSKTAEPGQESFGNVRLMHNRQTVGKLTKISYDDVSKVIYGVARITDDKTWEDIRKGVYSAFSIAGDLVRSTWKNGKQWITVKPKEVSVVDYPSNPESTFDWAKGVTFAKFASGLETKAMVPSTEGKSNSFDAIRNRVQDALGAKFDTKANNSYVWTRDISADKVVFCHDPCGRDSIPCSGGNGQTTYEAKYTDDGEKVYLGIPVEVAVAYTPVQKSGTPAFLPDAEPVKNQEFARENANLTNAAELADNKFVEDMPMSETQKIAGTETEVQKAARASIHSHVAAMKAAATSHLEAVQGHVAKIHSMADAIHKLAGEPAQTTGDERSGGQPGAKSETDTVVKTAETDVQKAARKEEKRKARIAETAEIVKAAIAPLTEKVEKITKAAEDEAAKVTGSRTDVVVTGKEVTKVADVTDNSEIKKLADAAFLNGNKPADPKALRALYDKTAVYDKPSWAVDKSGRRI